MISKSEYEMLNMRMADVNGLFHRLICELDELGCADEAQELRDIRFNAMMKLLGERLAGKVFPS